MRIDVIVNTTARRFRAKPALLSRAALVCAGRAELHLTGSLAELEAACRRIAGRGTDLLVLSGGDGSFMAGVTTLVGALGEAALPKIALIPGGTAATVARNWGMNGDPIELIRRVLRQTEAGASALRSTRRPTLRVRATTDEGPEERIGFIFGTGLVAKFFDLYYEDGGRGYGAAARIVARIFAESFVDGAYARRVLDPLPCTVEVDGRSLASPSWSLICAAVVPDLGIRMRVTYRAGEDPSRLHLVASPLSSRALGPRAPRVLAGRSIGGDGHFDDLVREFRVRRDDGLPYVLDGDRLRAREVLVRAGPPIDVLDPPGEDGRAA